MENNNIGKIIKEDLKKLADIDFKKFQEKLCPNIDNILGVKIPNIRKYAKELIKKYSINEIIENIDNEFYEEIMLEGIIISYEKDICTSIKYIERFIPKINNWAVCDTFCASLKIAKKSKEKMWELITKYVKSKKEFEIRFGIVMVIDYYLEESYIEEIFNILDEIETEDYYAEMAISWLISILLIKYYDKTVNYLKNAKLNNFIYNKALQKGIESYRIDKEKKNRLRQMKI